MIEEQHMHNQMMKAIMKRASEDLIMGTKLREIKRKLDERNEVLSGNRKLTSEGKSKPEIISEMRVEQIIERLKTLKKEVQQQIMYDGDISTEDNQRLLEIFDRLDKLV